MKTILANLGQALEPSLAGINGSGWATSTNWKNHLDLAVLAPTSRLAIGLR